MYFEQTHHHNVLNQFVNLTKYIPLERQLLHPEPAIHLPSSSTTLTDQID